MEERFWSKINKCESGCWEWTASTYRRGYGMFNYNGKITGAHRVAFELTHKRKIGEGLVIRHSCDNRLCVNPEHLSEGTQKDNIEDAKSRSRMRGGSSPNNKCAAKLTMEDVEAIRLAYSSKLKTVKELALDYKLHHNTIKNIVKFKSWI